MTTGVNVLTPTPCPCCACYNGPGGTLTFSATMLDSSPMLDTDFRITLRASWFDCDTSAPAWAYDNAGITIGPSPAVTLNTSIVIKTHASVGITIYSWDIGLYDEPAISWELRYNGTLLDSGISLGRNPAASPEPTSRRPVGADHSAGAGARSAGRVGQRGHAGAGDRRAANQRGALPA